MDSNLSRGLMILKRQTLLRLPRALYLRTGASSTTARTSIGSTNAGSTISADSVALDTNFSSGNATGFGGTSRRSFLLGRSQADDEQLLNSAAWSPGVQSIASGVSAVHRPSILSSSPSSPINTSYISSGQASHSRKLTTNNSSNFQKSANEVHFQEQNFKSSSNSTAFSFGQTKLSSWLLDSPNSSSQDITSIRRLSTDSNQSQMVSNSITSHQLPDDCWHAVYIGLLLCGVGFLLPYNCLVLASDYFQIKHPHSTIVFDLTLVYILTAFAAVCVCSASVRWPSGIFRMRSGAILSLLTMLGVGLMLIHDPLPNDEENSSLEWSMEHPINFVKGNNNIIILNENLNITKNINNNTKNIIMNLNLTNHDHQIQSSQHSTLNQSDYIQSIDNLWQYRLTLFSAALLAIGCTLQQSSLYGVAAQLPQRYTHALMTGESAAGLIAALIRFISRALMRPVQENTLLFFFLGFNLVCLCLVVQLRIPRSRFYKEHVHHHEQLVSGAATQNFLGNAASGPSSLVNPIYEEDRLVITADEQVPKSDSTEFELPFGIDEEELKIRLAHGWTDGEAARLGIRTLKRMKLKQEQGVPNDLTDIFNFREQFANGDEEEDDEDELFALHLAPKNPSKQQAQLARQQHPINLESVQTQSIGKLNENLNQDYEDELVFDVTHNFAGNSNIKNHPMHANLSSNQINSTNVAQSPDNSDQNQNTFSNRFINSIISRCPIFFGEHMQRVSTNYRQISHTMNKRMELCKRIWPHMISIWLAYAVTLSLFPGIESEIVDCDWRRWTPVMLMAIFNVTDLLGKLLASLCYRISAKQLLWASILRIILIPLLVACAGRHPKESVLNHFPSLAPLLSAILGITNGLLGSLPMILAPGRVPAHQRQLTGNVMTFCYLFGLTVGSLFAYALRAMFVKPLQPSDLDHYCSTNFHSKIKN